jgi:uncharacterized C2H2 Zn-finger protein
MLVEVHAGKNVSGCGGQTLSQTCPRCQHLFWAKKGEQQSNKVTKVKSGKRKPSRKKAQKAQNKIGNGRHDARDLKFERAYTSAATAGIFRFSLFEFRFAILSLRLASRARDA